MTIKFIFYQHYQPNGSNLVNVFKASFCYQDWDEKFLPKLRQAGIIPEAFLAASNSYSECLLSHNGIITSQDFIKNVWQCVGSHLDDFNEIQALNEKLNKWPTTNGWKHTFLNYQILKNSRFVCVQVEVEGIHKTRSCLGLQHTGLQARIENTIALEAALAPSSAMM